MNHDHESHDEPRCRPNMNWILIAFLAVAGFFLFTEHRAHLFGFLLQWPTLVTLIMFPILVFMYVRLARTEEHWAEEEFGDAYRRYKAETPAFIPHLRKGISMAVLLSASIA